MCFGSRPNQPFSAFRFDAAHFLLEKHFRRQPDFEFHWPARLPNRTDHVQRMLREIREFVVENPLAAVQRVFESHQLAGLPGELLRHEERLRQEPFQAARAMDRPAILP